MGFVFQDGKMASSVLFRLMVNKGNRFRALKKSLPESCSYQTYVGLHDGHSLTICCLDLDWCDSEIKFATNIREITRVTDSIARDNFASIWQCSWLSGPFSQFQTKMPSFLAGGWWNTALLLDSKFTLSPPRLSLDPTVSCLHEFSPCYFQQWWPCTASKQACLTKDIKIDNDTKELFNKYLHYGISSQVSKLR